MFTEAESRHFLRSILDRVEWLQRAGLTHKDISLENIIVNGGSTVIIDLGMCLRVPYLDDQLDGTNMPPQRCLINGRSPCGKVRLYTFFSHYVLLVPFSLMSMVSFCNYLVSYIF